MGPRIYPSYQNNSQLVPTPTPGPAPTATPTITPTPTPTPSFNPPITTSGLWLYSDGTYGRCYTSGLTWTDISPNSFTATFSTSTQYWEYYERYNGYFDFIGGGATTPGSFTFQNSASGTTTGNWSFGCWIAANPNGLAYFIHNGNIIDNGVANLVVMSNSSNQWRVDAFTTLGQVTCASNVSLVNDTTFIYVTGVWTSGSSLKIYINGVLNNTTVTTDTTLRTPTQAWSGGQWDNSPNLKYPFKLGDIQIYNTALTDAQVLNNYNAKKTIYQ